MASTGTTRLQEQQQQHRHPGRRSGPRHSSVWRDGARCPPPILFPPPYCYYTLHKSKPTLTTRGSQPPNHRQASQDFGQAFRGFYLVSKRTVREVWPQWATQIHAKCDESMRPCRSSVQRLREGPTTEGPGSPILACWCIGSWSGEVSSRPNWPTTISGLCRPRCEDASHCLFSATRWQSRPRSISVSCLFPGSPHSPLRGKKAIHEWPTSPRMLAGMLAGILCRTRRRVPAISYAICIVARVPSNKAEVECGPVIDYGRAPRAR